MKPWIIRFLQVAMAISLLAMPVQAASCSAMPVAKAGMSCCGPNCHCPMGKMCAEVPAPKADRAAAQPVLKISAPVATLLYALSFKLNTFSALSVQGVVQDARPPVLAVGSPPQARLRVWLI